jgi:uncharacterized membrane protein
MSDLVVLGFDGLHTADDVLNKLRSLQKEYLLDLEEPAWSSGMRLERCTSSRLSI